MLLEDYYLPTFIQKSDGFLTCACDMCFTEETTEGPHDLHCVCSSCLVFSLDEERYDRCLKSRYPDLFSENFKSNPYSTPPNSPTNKEMHAQNGNLSHQHHSGYGDFIRAAARGLHTRNPADRFATVGLGSSSLLGGSLFYTGTRNMGEPLSELWHQWSNKKAPSNKEMHAYNGNAWQGTGGTISWNPNQPSTDPSKQSGRRTKEPQIGPQPDRWNVPGPNDPNLPDIVPDMPSDDGIDGPKSHLRNDQNPVIPLDDHYNHQEDSNPAIQAVHDRMRNQQTGPSNAEMHMYNGNIPQRPYTKKFAAKMAKKAEKRKFKRKNKKGIVINNTIAKSKPRVLKPKLDPKDSAEKKLAMRYLSFLKHPTTTPPRIGSSGKIPTKILHGYYEVTINMASPGFGTNSALVNATDVVVFLTPKMFSYYSSGQLFAAPISIGLATSGTVAFTNVGSGGTATSTFGCPNFANFTALKNETGATSSSSALPLTRFLGGHVSLSCKCPMATTAPPSVFGGLLPSSLCKFDSTFMDPALQLNSFTNTEIRSLLCSTPDLPGMTISSVYAPATANQLQFDPNCCNYSGASFTPCYPIPYACMTGCPTTSTITLYVSAYFEVQQTSANAAYGGWGVGPKLSTEDIYDYLPNFKTVSPIPQGLGAKANSGTNSVMAQMRQLRAPEPESVDSKIADLQNTFKSLKIQMDLIDQIRNSEENEDEKYFDIPFVTETLPPKPHLGRVTPGSVTSKTSRTSLL